MKKEVPAKLILIVLFGLIVPVKADFFDELKKFALPAAIMIDDDKAAEMIGEIGSRHIEKKEGVYPENSRANSTINKLVNHLAQTPSARNYEFGYNFRILASNKVNAYALPGGHGYINRGVLNLRGVSADEIAFILAHEMSHMKKRHGFKRLKKSLIINVISNEVLDGENKLWADIAKGLYTARRSRKAERQADLLGIKIITEADLDPCAGLSFMRRLETLSKERKGPFEEFFATHPPTSERCKYLKDFAVKKETGLTYNKKPIHKEGIMSVQANFCPTHGYPPMRGLKMYQRKTKRKVYRTGRKNRYTRNGYRGECTWFAYATTKNVETGGDGADWYEAGIRAGYPTGSTPKPGSLAVWKKSSNGGFGHVAIVTKVYNSGNFQVWDSNWLEKQRVRCHTITNRRHLKGFVYLDNQPSKKDKEGIRINPDKKRKKKEEGRRKNKNKKQEKKNKKEKRKEKPKAKLRDEIVVTKGPHLLGDEEAPHKVLWFEEVNIIKEEIESVKKAFVTVEIRGLPNKDPKFSINRKKIGMAVTGSTQWEKFEFPVRTKFLHTGKNLFDAETIITDIRDSFDDCEFRNLILHMKY